MYELAVQCSSSLALVDNLSDLSTKIMREWQANNTSETNKLDRPGLEGSDN